MTERIPPKMLIFSDLDDTLQPRSTGTIDPRFYTEIPRLAERGIFFCIASGRNKKGLLRSLAPVSEDIYFICENGAEIYWGSELLCRNTLPRELAGEIVRSIADRPDCFARVNADKSYYLGDEAFVRTLMRDPEQMISSFDEVCGEIRQVTAGCPENNRQALETLRPMWGSRIAIAVNGPHWVDFTPMGKGKAVQWLCDFLGVSSQQVYAFGDNHNDRSMLETVGHPYLMENAPEELKALFPNRTANVTETILQLDRSGIL